MKVKLLLCVLFCLFSMMIRAQGEKPVYFSFAYGFDQNLDKFDRTLPTHPMLLSLTLEKRLSQSDFYGLGLHAYRFISVFNNYNQFSIRGYQHFGYASNTNTGNFDPYVGAFVGGETYRGSFKPAVGIFVGARFMFIKTAGLHLEFVPVSSGFNSSTLFQFGITTRFIKSEFPRLKKWGSKCPK